MRDELSQFPGRIRLVPVSGMTNVYDVVDESSPIVQGTPLNTETLLSAATAALFGLDGDNATVSNALAGASNSITSVNTALSGMNTRLNNAIIILYFTPTIGTTWTGSVAPFTQTVTVTGLKATDRLLIGPLFSDVITTYELQQAAWNLISKITPNNNSITVRCNRDKPITAIPLQILALRRLEDNV